MTRDDLIELMNAIKESKLPVEFFDFLDVIDFGARKYTRNDWLKKDGKKVSEYDMHASMLRHFNKSLNSEGTDIEKMLDDESKLDHLLHLATRALMLYTIRKRKSHEHV